jgi:hypothetical protein
VLDTENGPGTSSQELAPHLPSAGVPTDDARVTTPASTPSTLPAVATGDASPVDALAATLDTLAPAPRQALNSPAGPGVPICRGYNRQGSCYATRGLTQADFIGSRGVAVGSCAFCRLARRKYDTGRTKSRRRSSKASTSTAALASAATLASSSRATRPSTIRDAHQDGDYPSSDAVDSDPDFQVDASASTLATLWGGRNSPGRVRPASASNPATNASQTPRQPSLASQHSAPPQSPGASWADPLRRSAAVHQGLDESGPPESARTAIEEAMFRRAEVREPSSQVDTSRSDLAAATFRRRRASCLTTTPT